MISVAIIEDDPVTRLGLAKIVDDATMTRLASVASCVEEFEARSVTRPDVVVLDLRLKSGEIEGAPAVRHLHAQGHRILVVSMFEEEIPVLDAISAGAHGYLTKEAEPEEIIRALTAVSVGRTYFSATVAGYLLKKEIRLTARETEILRLVAGGETAADVAQQLFISEKTVNGHLDRIRDKTGYRRRPDLTRLAYEKGIMSWNRRKK